MEFTYSNDGFLPYESFDYIFNEREMPEFGKVASPYVKMLTTWKFYLANGQTEVPFGVMNNSFDDSEWALVNCPSTWQTEGFGLPQNLIYSVHSSASKWLGINSRSRASHPGRQAR